MSRDESFDIYHKSFVQQFNRKFAHNFLNHPDVQSEPCLDETGKVKKRGDWDRGTLFSDKPKSDFTYTKYQNTIREFLQESSFYRGLLLFHGVGSGKTASAIGVGERMKHARQILVLSPASLRDNFLSELKKSGGEEYHLPKDIASTAELEAANKRLDQKILRKYSFISYDAPNMIAQIEALPGQLNNKLVIIDEAHNLVSMISSQSKKGVYIFFKIMQASNLKLLLLTGTPVINSPFEIAITANLLTGYLDAKTQTRITEPNRRLDKDKRMMFEREQEFLAYFVKDSSPPEMQNINALKNRLNGIVSFYAGAQPSAKILPRVHQHWIEVQMSNRQFELYDRARQIERISEKKLRQNLKRAKKGTRKAVDFSLMFNTKKDGPKLCNFRAFSRQFANFAFPPGIPRWLPRIGDINSDDFVVKDEKSELQNDDMTTDTPEDVGKYSKDEALKLTAALDDLESQADRFLVRELQIHSAKMHKMFHLLNTSDGPVYVYSQFRTMEGIGIFARVLRAHGYIEYGWRDPFFKTPMQPMPHSVDCVTGKRFDTFSERDLHKFQPLTYIMWPNSSPNNAKREHLLNAYNSEDNKHGKVIKVFLSTKSGAEGINLMNVRQVHIMEPYWNNMLIRQAIGRAVRICSHATLPVKERQVDVYHYMSLHDDQTSPDKEFESNRQQSTDQYVRNVALAKANLTDALEHMLKEVAIDCRLNYNHNSLGSDRRITCFDYLQNDNNKKTFALDILQEQTDDDVAAETQTVTKHLVPIHIKQIGEVRFDQNDMVILKRFFSKQFKPKEVHSIALWHRVSVEPVGTLVLEYPDKTRFVAKTP